jgi:hypothetical protein
MVLMKIKAFNNSPFNQLKTVNMGKIEKFEDKEVELLSPEYSQHHNNITSIYLGRESGSIEKATKKELSYSQHGFTVSYYEKASDVQPYYTRHFKQSYQLPNNLKQYVNPLCDAYTKFFNNN